ncbi:MAG: NAD-dependent epimerase/dehydratase family protein [Alphaproteobacteria bacterium]|nr:NAD-dependent epimerase/dehydratase family protein [Alphaproteobacteria bacterium]
MNTILINEYEQIYNMLGERVQEFENQSILVTGATGLIGGYILDFLVWMNKQHNANIQIYAVATSYCERDGVKYIQCDLSIPNSLSIKTKFHQIIHAAGPTDPTIYATNPIGVMKTNIIGTMQILDVAVQSNARVVFLSSGEVYGHNRDHDFTECDPCIVDTRTARACYPAAKIAAEALCQSYAQTHNLYINIVRPGFVYGPNIADKSMRVNAQFLRQAMARKNILLNSQGNQRRSWVYVADVASGILFVMLNASRGDNYNIANNKSVATIYQYACTMA